MQVTVFGASGKVGQKVVQKLLSNGYDVVAFTHNSAVAEADRLTIAHGDIHSLRDVIEAVKGSEVVISAVGSWGTKEKDIVSKGIDNIISAMITNKTRRVISLTGSDAIDSSDKHSSLSSLMHALINLSPARKILQDGEKHIELLKNSNLDWTVLRSPVMTNSGDSGKYELVLRRPKPWATINRQSVAEAMVSLIDDRSYYKKAPFIQRTK
ncbi:MAG TPA: NAD(P)-binding oxidoreductase [Candidatus Saccharimonadales bacterium]|nr:NAD(P)-binding oxidoreductase [Candidatus Saccharimonadales bacterium]